MTTMNFAFQHLKVVSGWVTVSNDITGRVLRHRDGFTAREIIVGAHKSIGFVVLNPDGSRLGVVSTVHDLP